MELYAPCSLVHFDSFLLKAPRTTTLKNVMSSRDTELLRCTQTLHSYANINYIDPGSLFLLVTYQIPNLPMSCIRCMHDIMLPRVGYISESSLKLGFYLLKGVTESEQSRVCQEDTGWWSCTLPAWCTLTSFRVKGLEHYHYVLMNVILQEHQAVHQYYECTTHH